MPFDPNSPFGPADLSQWWRSLTLPRVQSNAPPNSTSGNPAASDGIDDWFVPAPAPSPAELPNDWIAPWSAETDASYPDDWIYPNNPNVPTAPSTAPPAPSPQPSVANPAISNRPAPPPDPFAAYWALIPASRVGAMAWHPPIFPNSLGQFPLPTPAPRDVWPTVGEYGLLGGVGRMLAERAAASRDPAANGLLGAVGRMVAAREQANDPWAAAANGILGGIAKMTPAPAPTSAPPIDAAQGLLDPLVNLQPATPNGQADASYAPDSRAFISPAPTRYQGGRPFYATAGSTDIAPATATGLQPEEASVQLAQALPPIFFARPPMLIPRQLTPLEDLPPGSAGGPNAGKPFPRSFIDQQPEGVPCTYCGRPTTKEPGPDKLHGDHVIPRIQGGNSDPENFAPACRTCNLEKGPRTPEEWYFWLRGGGET